MNSNEFIDGLRAALQGEIPEVEIENNIRYYEEYIHSKSINSTQEDVVKQLGDPRLIAKTIIETYQISHGPMYTKNKNDHSDFNSYQESDNQYNTNHNRHNIRFNIHTPFKWYQKATIIMVSIIVILLFIIIGGLLLRLLFSVGVPLLIIYAGYRLLKNSMKR